MKNTKDRVIALDYFRGILILMVILNHSLIFSMPFTILAGAGILWTTAAELFLLISGITLWVVRGDAIEASLRETTQKIWKRAALIYLINITVVSLSLLLALYLTSRGLTNDVDGALPAKTSIGLLADILSFKYTIGWANFLMYFSLMLFLAPFVMYGLKTKIWPIITALSLLIFSYFVFRTARYGIYGTFGIWQVYFFLGLTIGRFRIPILQWYWSLSKRSASLLANFVAGIGCTALLLSIFLEFNLYPYVSRMAESGWLPLKFQTAYIHYLGHKGQIDYFFVNSRAGILRPLAAVLFLATAYMLYQKHKGFLIRNTGNFVNAFGRDTLWIFVAQAFAIPILAALPLRRTLFTNFFLTATLIILMWAITKRRLAWQLFQAYNSSLKLSYIQAKQNYLQQYQDG